MSPLRRSRRPNDNRVLRGDAPHIDGSDLLVFDADPLSLLATAGALHTAGHRCVCARNASAAHQAAGGTAPGVQRPSAIVMDVGDDATAALQTLEALRQLDGNASMPAVLIATADWAGLEKKVELIQSPTRCLFKPIDPQSLIAVVDSLLWMPALQQTHRRKARGRAGWVTL